MKFNKNKLIVLFSVLLAAIAMILTYPLIDKAAKNDQIPEYADDYSTEVYSDAMIGTLPRYYELMKQQNEDIQPYELFIEQNSEIDNKNIAQQVTDAINDEIQYLNTQHDQLKYYVTDKEQTSFITNGTETEVTDMKTLLEGNDIKTNAWYLVYSFDNNGILSVIKQSDDHGASWISDTYQRNLKSLFSLTNLRIRTGQDENGEYTLYYNEAANGEVKGPQNTSYVFMMDHDTLIKIYGIDVSEDWYQTIFYGEHIIKFFVLILTVLGLVLFLLYRSDPKELPFFKLFKKIPTELHLVIAFMVFPLLSSMGLLVKYTMEHQHMFFISGEVKFIYGYFYLYVIENGLFWFLIFGYFAYLFLSLQDMKKRKAWREYFITRRFLHWVKTTWNKTIHFIAQIDLTQKDDKRIATALLINFFIMSILVLMWGFGLFFLIIYSVILFVLAKKYLTSVRHDYDNLLDVTKHIASGNLDSEITIDLGIFNDFKNHMVDIRSGFKQAVEEEVHSQRMKTELITNVSHDLKTPLTSIITYIDLLKKDHISEEDRAKYMDTLDRNSIRLKHLIDDLFEVSKANSGAMQLERMNMDIVSLMKQVQFECKDKFEARHLQVKNSFSDEKILCYMDPQKTYRIFENLISNIGKYALDYTRVYVDITDYENRIDIILRNISADELTFDPEDITERFTRGDSSRNTEGSGLGLSIAKSFTELQGGTLRVSVDGDLFKVHLSFIRTKQTNEKKGSAHSAAPNKEVLSQRAA